MDDHLSLVANLTRLQQRELEGVGIKTLTSLAMVGSPWPHKPERGQPATYERLMHQARLQLAARSVEVPPYELLEIEPEIDPLRRLVALIDADGDATKALAERLRFSNAWRDRLQGLVHPWPIEPQGDTRAQRLALYRLGRERHRDIALLMAADQAITTERLDDLLALARTWTPPRFPLAGRDVVGLGIPPGERVGELLDRVRAWWEACDFTADRTQSKGPIEILP